MIFGEAERWLSILNDRPLKRKLFLPDDTKNTSDLNFAPESLARGIDRRIKLRKRRKREKEGGREEGILAECGAELTVSIRTQIQIDRKVPT